MNYDPYVKSVLCHDFPVIFDNLLYFIDEYPDFKGKVHLSGQTFLFLQKFATHVVDHAGFHGYSIISTSMTAILINYKSHTGCNFHSLNSPVIIPPINPRIIEHFIHKKPQHPVFLLDTA